MASESVIVLYNCRQLTMTCRGLSDEQNYAKIFTFGNNGMLLLTRLHTNSLPMLCVSAVWYQIHPLSLTHI